MKVFSALKETVLPDFVLNFTVVGFLSVLTAMNLTISLAMRVCYQVEGSYDKRYTGLIIQDLRRSASRNLIVAGVSEKVAMTVSGSKTCSVFDRYHIVDSADVQRAMRRVENLVPVSEKTVKMLAPTRARKRQVADSKRTAVSSRG